MSLLFGWAAPGSDFGAGGVFDVRLTASRWLAKQMLDGDYWLACLSSQPGGMRKGPKWAERPVGDHLPGLDNCAVRDENDGDQSVNAPARLDSTPCLDDFPYRLSDNVRFGDLDPNQHVNNAVYATYFETGRVTLMKDRSLGLVPEGLAWIMVRLDMHFRAELRWPGKIELGLGVTKLGRTSVTFEQVVFSEGRCVASAQAVTVLIDDLTRKPTPLTDDVIRNFQPWLKRGADGR
jgi:acyl-CoA thioester hydrolase